MPIRSPSYPSVSLPEALEKAKQFYDLWGQIDISMKDSLNCWGYSPSSGVGHKLVAAMISFGLLDAIGHSADRRLRISDVALNKLFSDYHTKSENSDFIQQFALNPKIYRTLWEKWGYDLPGDSELRRYLIHDLHFNSKVVTKFLRGYLETIDMMLEQGSTGQGGHNDEDDTDLKFDAIDLVPGQEPPNQGCSNNEDDTDLKFDAVDLVLEQEPPNQGSYDDEDDTDLKFYGVEEDSIRTPIPFSSSRDNPNSRPKTTTVLNTKGKEIARYSVATNCRISLIADGPVDRAAVQTLIAQLSLDLESGIFDPEIDD